MSGKMSPEALAVVRATYYEQRLPLPSVVYGGLLAHIDAQQAEAAADAELVALLLAEARSHRALDSAPPSDPLNEIWLRWFGDADALDAAVQARLEGEGK